MRCLLRGIAFMLIGMIVLVLPASLRAGERVKKDIIPLEWLLIDVRVDTTVPQWESLVFVLPGGKQTTSISHSFFYGVQVKYLEISFFNSDPVGQKHTAIWARIFPDIPVTFWDINGQIVRCRKNARIMFSFSGGELVSYAEAHDQLHRYLELLQGTKPILLIGDLTGLTMPLDPCALGEENKLVLRLRLIQNFEFAK